jgi:Zn-dependent M16 (insulinase) family peptidase
MQGRENTSGDLMALRFVGRDLNKKERNLRYFLMLNRLQRLLHPPGSGYRSETGGLMDALRVLTPQQSKIHPSAATVPNAEYATVRDYHSRYYVPHNLALIVAGKLSSGTSSLLQVIQEQVEPSLIDHKQNHGARPFGWKRPFVETASALRKPIPKTIKDTVEFPEQDESG